MFSLHVIKSLFHKSEPMETNLSSENDIISDVEGNQIFQHGFPERSSPSEHKRTEVLLVRYRHFPPAISLKYSL